MAKLTVDPDKDGYIVWEKVLSEDEEIPSYVHPYSKTDTRLACDCDEPGNEGLPMVEPCSHVRAVNRYIKRKSLHQLS